ncbi:MAG: hypothetical protein HY246_01885, partial [Proteobacteria bacterium]|nr:hypothetical protein [Pseudomonadota bacterium]
AIYAAQLGKLEPSAKAEHLSRCGFSNSEVAAILGLTPNAVNIALHRARKAAKASGKRRKTQ